MSRNRFTEEFKRDAVAQVVDRGYAVSEVAERLGNDLRRKYPPALCRVLWVELMALCGQFVHCFLLCKFHGCLVSQC